MIGWFGFVSPVNPTRIEPISRQKAPAPEIVLTNSAGKRVRPLTHFARPTEFVFVLADCPIANAYSPELARLAASYKGKADFVLVLVDRGLNPAQAAKHSKEFGIRFTTLLDPNRTLASRLKVTISPEACLVDAKGRVAYEGRIDDSYPQLGVRRPHPTRRDLSNALGAVTAHRRPKVTRTTAVGCVISKL